MGAKTGAKTEAKTEAKAKQKQSQEHWTEMFFLSICADAQSEQLFTQRERERENFKAAFATTISQSSERQICVTHIRVQRAANLVADCAVVLPLIVLPDRTLLAHGLGLSHTNHRVESRGKEGKNRYTEKSERQ